MDRYTVPIVIRELQKYSYPVDSIIILTTFIVICFITLSMYRVLKNPKDLVSLFLLIIAVNYLYWVLVINSLECMSCSLS